MLPVLGSIKALAFRRFRSRGRVNIAIVMNKPLQVWKYLVQQEHNGFASSRACRFIESRLSSIGGYDLPFCASKYCIQTMCQAATIVSRVMLLGIDRERARHAQFG